jgi:hypothetical protein
MRGSVDLLFLINPFVIFFLFWNKFNNLSTNFNFSSVIITIIKSAADLISTQTPDYQYLAARLAIFPHHKNA